MLGIFYNKTETYIKSEKLYEVLYRVEGITMGNKVKFNLKNVHAAKLTEKEEGEVQNLNMAYQRLFRELSVSVWTQKENQSVLCRWNRIFPFRDKQWL